MTAPDDLAAAVATCPECGWSGPSGHIHFCPNGTAPVELDARLRALAATQARQGEALRRLASYVQGGMNGATFHGDIVTTAIDRALDDDTGEGERSFAAWIDFPGIDLAALATERQPAPAPPPGEMPGHPADGLPGPVVAAVKCLDDAGRHGVAAGLMDWAAAQPPALDAEARKMVVAHAEWLEELAGRKRPDKLAWPYIAQGLQTVAARLRALAGEP